MTKTNIIIYKNAAVAWQIIKPLTPFLSSDTCRYMCESRASVADESFVIFVAYINGDDEEATSLVLRPDEG